VLTAAPLIYCPVGVERPACCAHRHPIGLLPKKGPDAVTTTVNGQEETTGGGGNIYGATGYDPALRSKWRKTRAGWWALLTNQKPQDLIRMQRHPRVRTWSVVPGAHAGHEWQVPVLFEMSDSGITSALDGLWDGERYTGGDLEPLQQELLALINGIDQGSPVDIAAEVRRLAAAGLGLGQYVDLDLLALAGWLSESLALSTVIVMAGRTPA
jgi:hypothetical protein